MLNGATASRIQKIKQVEIKAIKKIDDGQVSKDSIKSLMQAEFLTLDELKQMLNIRDA